ncbi:RNA polymerase sigma factor [Algoriphagus sp. CAU 1675]|uniref:RNA polymerase sigma factor n=1 Tax=Algoriphagus sp. CAU 1675 TaxID=3032597 RepID=UPI0023DBBA76|nr:RNA polymerase sigma factor [Algoriphagus sp. CAU 1675]MDF2157050.1 RNA polymerase sigma factor [Algoriphagus sp. CAU 1675]
MKKPLVNPKEIQLLPQVAAEKRLFLGCLEGNPKIQRELFNKLSPKMLSICLRYIKETAAAEDVLIIAFGKVFDRIGQFQQRGSFEGWIRRIVVNECLMHLEKERNLFREIGLENIYPVANQYNPSDLLEWNDMVSMLNFLPSGYRKVFELFVLKGMSHEEIGKTLGISENTSKSQLSRARVYLQRLMEYRNNKN